MRILHVNNWLPAPPVDGGKMRKLQQLAALVRAHEVSVLGRVATAEDGPWLESHLPGCCVIEAKGAADGTADTTAAIRAVLGRERFDALHISGVPQWPGTRGLEALPLVLDVDSIESRVLDTLRLAGASAITPLDVAAVQALERHAFARATRVIACSGADADAIRALAPRAHVIVAPNAIDVASFMPTPVRVPGEVPVLTFTGFLAYRPNADACLHFVFDILPLLRSAIGEVSVRLVGRLPPEDVQRLTEVPGVAVIANVPDIRPYLVDADVIVVPLRAGSGTRLKILEAFAAGRPVVSTALGCEGLDVADGEHLAIADHPLAFAAAILRVLRERDVALRFVAAGRALVERRYDRAVVERDIAAIYDALGNERGGGWRAGVTT